VSPVSIVLAISATSDRKYVVWWSDRLIAPDAGRLASRLVAINLIELAGPSE